MATSLSSLVNLSEGIHRIKCKYGYDDKKIETCGIKLKYCNFFLEYTNFKDDLIDDLILCCNKNYRQKCDEKSKERFLNACNFSNHDSNKFILLLQTFVYPYEHMDD